MGPRGPGFPSAPQAGPAFPEKAAKSWSESSFFYFIFILGVIHRLEITCNLVLWHQYEATIYCLIKLHY